MLSDPRFNANGAGCSHENSISVITRGLEHVICEDCGDVIVRYSSAVSGDVKRSQFARQAGFLHKLLDESAEPT